MYAIRSYYEYAHGSKGTSNVGSTIEPFGEPPLPLVQSMRVCAPRPLAIFPESYNFV